MEYEIPLGWKDRLNVAIEEGCAEDTVHSEAREYQERDTHHKLTDSDEQGDFPWRLHRAV